MGARGHRLARSQHGGKANDEFGCGAYGNPPREVATIFKQELHSFHFHNVVFAIIDPVGTGNLKQFRKVLCGNGGSRKQAKK